MTNRHESEAASRPIDRGDRDRLFEASQRAEVRQRMAANPTQLGCAVQAEFRFNGRLVCCPAFDEFREQNRAQTARGVYA